MTWVFCGGVRAQLAKARRKKKSETDQGEVRGLRFNPGAFCFCGYPGKETPPLQVDARGVSEFNRLCLLGVFCLTTSPRCLYCAQIRAWFGALRG